MPQTRLCALLNIDLPILQAPIGPGVSPELVAAVSNAGGLGALAAILRPAAELREIIERTTELLEPGRGFAVNHVINTFDEEAFEATLAARPMVISFALGDPGELVAHAHGAGSLVMQQVVTVESAYAAAENGADVIIAQGSEAGGNSGLISTLALVPQVVDAVAPVPVVASGGIADGRGLAAALMLGADGISIGTRFLASVESAADVSWQAAVVNARSQDVQKFPPWNDAFPPAPGNYFTIPMAIQTPFTEDWMRRETEGEDDGTLLRDEVVKSATEHAMASTVPLAGQTAGMIDAVLPAAQIVRQIAEQADQVLFEAGSRYGARSRIDGT